MPLIQVINDGDGDGNGADIVETVVRRTASFSLNEGENANERALHAKLPSTSTTPTPSGEAGGMTSIEARLVDCYTAAACNNVNMLESAIDRLQDEILLIKGSKGGCVASRYNTALRLIRLAPVSTSDSTAPDGQTSIKSKLEQCLEACGPSCAFLAASNLLRGDAASATGTEEDAALHADKLTLTKSVVHAIQIARRAIFGGAESDDADARSSSLGHLCQDYVRNYGTPLMRKQSMRDLADRAILLPVGIGSACHRVKLQFPSWATRERYCKRLIEVSLEAVALAASEKRPKNYRESVEELFFASVLEKMSHHGASDPAVLGLHRYWSRVLNDSGINTALGIGQSAVSAFSSIVMTAVTKITPHRDAAVLLRSLMRYAASELDEEHICLLREKTMPRDSEEIWSMKPMLFLLHACLPTLKSSEILCVHFFRLVVMSPPPSESLSLAGAQEYGVDARWLIIPYIASLIFANMSDETLSQHLLDASEAWGESVFVQKTDPQSQQLHVTEFIEASIPLLDKDKIDAEIFQAITLALVQGVTARLDSSNILIRRQGMRVAELLAPLLGQNLHFAELDESRSTTGSGNLTKLPVAATRKKSFQVKGGVGNGANDDDSVWSDEDLIPYDLEDDEDDLAPVKRPRYLRDCLALFRTPSDDKDAFDATQAALTTIASLVDSNPPDLADLAIPLTKELLFAEDKFHMNDFALLRWDGLCALLVQEPISVANLLVEVLTDGSPFGVRLDILGLLEYGADKLCGAAKLRENRQAWQKTSKEETGGKPRVSGKRRLVPYNSKEKTELCGKQQVELLEQKSRRWGQGRRNLKQPSETNRFGQIAPMWFYQLISAWVQTKDNVSIWGGGNGSKFFANYLVALAKIVECSGNHPGTTVLALDLFQLAMPFRHAESSEIRMAVLVTIATCCPFLPAEVFSKSYDGEDFSSYLTIAASRDTDASCRQIAGIVGRSIASTDALDLVLRR